MNRAYFSIVLVALFSTQVITSNNKSIIIDTSWETIDDLEKDFKEYIDWALKIASPYLMKYTRNIKISPICMRSVLRTIIELRELKEWAVKLIDATAKPSSGITETTAWFQGDYDQCLRIIAPKTENESTTEENILFRGQYCVLKLKGLSLLKRLLNNEKDIMNLDKRTTISKVLYHMRTSKNYVTIRFDLCIPSTCSVEDLETVISSIFGRNCSLEVDYCTTKTEKMDFSIKQIVCIFSFALFGVWVIIATCLDLLFYFDERSGSFISRWSDKLILCIRSISVYRSFLRLCSTEIGDRLNVFNGVRVLSIYAVILAHTYWLPFFYPTTLRNLNNEFIMIQEFLFQFVMKTFLAVDTFFFISGFFCTYQIMVREHFSRWNYLWVTLYRISRFIILNLSTIAILIILPHLSDGPHWKDIVVNQGKKCEQDWWKFLFAMSSINLSQNNCAVHLWFISSLMQLIILTTALLMIIFKWPKTVIPTICVLILIGIVSNTTYFFTTDNAYFVGVHGSAEEYDFYLKNNYSLSYSHLSQFSLGLLNGYLLGKRKKILLAKWLLYLGWCVAFFLMGLSIFALYPYTDEKYPDKNVILAYNSLHQFLWILGIAWICTACVTGYGGIINQFLSANFFVILDRLNIWLYTLHYIIIHYYIGNMRTPIYSSHLNTLSIYCFVLLFSTSGAVICYLFIQSPLIYCIRQIIPLRSQQEKKKETTDEGILASVIGIGIKPIPLQ